MSIRIPKTPSISPETPQVPMPQLQLPQAAPKPATVSRTCAIWKRNQPKPN